MAYTKVKNLKVGDIYFDKGLTVNGDLINTECLGFWREPTVDEYAKDEAEKNG